MTLLDEALAYADRGWQVHPCLPGDKRPATKWRDTATTEMFDVAGWWQGQWPSANIGIATGADSGLVVLDIDNLESLPALKTHGLPSTLTARTPRGGLHLYFQHPGEHLPNSAGERGWLAVPGVDVRGDGGYVLAPPSALPNGRYMWVEHRDLAPLPGWMLERYRASRDRAVSAPGGSGQIPEQVGTTRWGATVLERELASLVAAAEGQRNDTLYHAAMKVAGACKADQLDERHASRQLQVVADRIGLNSGEATATIESAWQVAEPRGPRDRPQAMSPTGVPVEPPSGPAPEPQVQVDVEPEPAAGMESGFLTVTELMDLPPLQWLIPGQLPVGLSMLFAPYGAGKTFAVLDWTLALACGRIDGTPKTVCYALGEGVAGFGSRVRAWTTFHQQQVPADRFLVRAGTQFPRLGDSGSVAELCRDIERLPAPPDLLVVDTLARSLAGGDEDAQGFGHTVAVCDDLLNRYGMSTLLVHHSGVNPERERGHTSLGAACDSIWKLEPPDVEAGGRNHQMKHVKSKEDQLHPSIERQINAMHGSAVMLPPCWRTMRDGGSSAV